MSEQNLKYVLEIDAGNTRIKWRLLDITWPQKILDSGFLLHQDSQQLLEPLKRAQRVRFSSVADKELREFVRSNLNEEAQLFTATSLAHCAGVKNSYTYPERLGVDRWLAMVAGYNLLKQGCCVIDCGSAITVDYVKINGEHRGGFIVPGLKLLEQSLVDKTALIKDANEISEQGVSNASSIRWGENTAQAIQYGRISMLSTWLNSLIEQAQSQRVQILITGGDALTLIPHLNPNIKFIPDLVLDGLFFCDPMNGFV